MHHVDVIVPNYNHENFLAKRLQSVFNQTYVDFKVTILDDCSSDNSRGIIENYSQHPKLNKVIYNSTNSGTPFKQWQKGIEASSAQFIWIAESDDYAEEDFLKSVMSKFQTNQEIGLIQVATVVVDEKGDYLGYEEIKEKDVESIIGKEFIFHHMLRGCTLFNASSIVFKRNLVTKGVFDEVLLSMKSSGDWLFWNRILHKTSIGFVQKKLNYFRRHQDATSSIAIQSGKHLVEGFKVYLETKKCIKLANSKWYSSDKYWAFMIINYGNTLINWKIIFNKLYLNSSQFILWIIIYQTRKLLTIKN